MFKEIGNVGSTPGSPLFQNDKLTPNASNNLGMNSPSFKRVGKPANPFKGLGEKLSGTTVSVTAVTASKV